MILDALVRYADERLEQPPEMHVYKNVRYIVELDSCGMCQGITEPVSEVDEGGDRSVVSRRTPRRGVTLTVPRLAVNRSGTKPKPILLADNGEYGLCVAREGGDELKVSERHESFVTLLSECYGRTANASVGAVLAFLDRLAGGDGDPASPSSATADVAYRNLTQWGLLPEEFDPTGTVTFRVEQSLPIEDEAVRRFWAEYTEDESLPYGRCYVTGEVRRLVKRMPGGVRGVPGGQQSGAKLVAVNRDAFESYGLENALNCPLSREAAIKVDAALNALLADPDSSFTAGSSAYCFFTLGSNSREGIGQLPSVAALAREVLTSPREEAVDGVSELRQRPESVNSPDGGSREARMYCLTLAANSSRLIVKDFSRAGVPEMVDNLWRWLSAQEIFTPDGRELAFPRGVFGLIGATLTGGEDLSARLRKVPAEADSYVHSALTGAPLPERTLTALSRRNRQERGVSLAQAQLAKLALVMKGVLDVSDLKTAEEQPDLAGADRDAYHLGRLLATLESIQIASAGRRPSASVVDRHYAMASTSPARGFASPLSLAMRAHLPRLRRRRPGAYNALNAQLEEVREQLPMPLPTTLTTERQALFALGYYYQSTRNRSRALQAGQKASTETT